ncbi:MAG: ribosome small subunit-dependent GTPase A [Halanaerobiales bacterium]|nr:ribosome small subunit-dependent GTPase A [Halanaerobiales bacterium]
MLNNLGFNRYKFNIENNDNVGRVVAQYRNIYKINNGKSEIMAILSGKEYYKASKSDFPVVGDWVVYERYNMESNGVIKSVLKRTTKLSRQEAGRKEKEQIIASNIDLIFIVTSLNQEFNKRRLERYLTIAWDSGAKPIIILNKSDLCDNLGYFKSEVENIAFNTPYIISSCVKNQGIQEIRDIISPDKTAVLIGSSGVGKSSIINMLLGKSSQATKNIRENDDRGKHTTTNRELFLIPTGGIIIDTPGMREIQLWVDENSLDNVFSEIDELSAECKYNDCTHEHEPGCAVKLAVQEGVLNEERLDNYFKMKREIQYQKLKEKYNSNRANKIKWKKLKNQ